MSEMAETSQSSMGPYVSMAAVGLAMNSWTAVCREALLVKVPGGDVGGEGGEGGEGGGEGGEGGEGGGDGDGGEDGGEVVQSKQSVPGAHDSEQWPSLASSHVLSQRGGDSEGGSGMGDGGGGEGDCDGHLGNALHVFLQVRRACLQAFFFPLAFLHVL